MFSCWFLGCCDVHFLCFFGKFVGGIGLQLVLLFHKSAQERPPSVSAVPGKRGMNIMNSFMNVSCLQVDRWLTFFSFFQLSGCRVFSIRRIFCHKKIRQTCREKITTCFTEIFSSSHAQPLHPTPWQVMASQA